MEGYGLWSTLYGYLALDNRLPHHPKGITYYDARRDGGAGGRGRQPDRWKALWPGRLAFDENCGKPKMQGQEGSPRARSGSPTPTRWTDSPELDDHVSNGVTNMIHFWLGRRRLRRRTSRSSPQPRQDADEPVPREVLLDPLIDNNPIGLQVLGICSALAVTTKLDTAFVMTPRRDSSSSWAANLSVSLLRHQIPGSIRIITSAHDHRLPGDDRRPGPAWPTCTRSVSSSRSSWVSSSPTASSWAAPRPSRCRTRRGRSLVDAAGQRGGLQPGPAPGRGLRAGALRDRHAWLRHAPILPTVSEGGWYVPERSDGPGAGGLHPDRNASSGPSAAVQARTGRGGVSVLEHYLSLAIEGDLR